MERIDRIGVHPGTKLEMITMHPDGTVRIWTAIQNKQVPPEKYVGTYLEIHPCGKIVQGGNDDELEIRPSRR